MSLTNMGNSQRAGKEQAIFDFPITELFLHCIKLSASLDYTSREVRVDKDSNILQRAPLVHSPRFVLKGVPLVPGQFHYLQLVLKALELYQDRPWTLGFDVVQDTSAMTALYHRRNGEICFT